MKNNTILRFPHSRAAVSKENSHPPTPPSRSSLTESFNQDNKENILSLRTEANLTKDGDHLKKQETIVKNNNLKTYEGGHIAKQSEVLNNKMDNSLQELDELRFLEHLVEIGRNFEESHDLTQLKGEVRENYGKFHAILEEIYDVKENREKIKNRNREIEFEISNNNVNMNVLAAPDSTEITDMEQIIVNLAKELKEQNQENEKIRSKITKKPFYREYEMMVKELEGIRIQNKNMGEMLTLEKEKEREKEKEKEREKEKEKEKERKKQK